jgi:primosomal protein N'
MDPECNPIEYLAICEKCEDKLTGHEDESGTLCRWCVTCEPLNIDTDSVSQECE